MNRLYNSSFLGTALIAAAACTDSAHVQLGAISPDKATPDTVTLPSVTVIEHAPVANATPAAPSPGHFEVWTGYDSDVALHPYTSGLGPCPQKVFTAGCHAAIAPSHYERPPFTDMPPKSRSGLMLGWPLARQSHMRCGRRSDCPYIALSKQCRTIDPPISGHSSASTLKRGAHPRAADAQGMPKPMINVRISSSGSTEGRLIAL
jgi:hypothetical protein